MPKAMMLMNDVFGNYVIQKVLELGPDEHREELAQLMKGHVSAARPRPRARRQPGPVPVCWLGKLHVKSVPVRGLAAARGRHQCLASSRRPQVLNLSLQMYSCRVVQRALEVCTMERRISLVRELQDHAVRCVRDQNGNHVIQK